MERIKQALELARQEREKKAQENGGSITASTRPKVVSVDEITYQETKSIPTPKSFLKNKHIIADENNSAYVEAYKILRTQVLQRMRENNWNVLGITSPNSGEGKTLTAINLAISLAKELDCTVLLVDADLRHPRVHSSFNLHPEYGLSDYLINDVPVSKLLINPQDIPHFVILPGGKPLSNSSEMLGSPKMSALVEDLKTRYPSRIVLFDLPPLLSVADTIAFSPYVDATLLVVENGKTTQDELNNSVSLLESTNVIGTVLNNAGLNQDDRKKMPGWSSIIIDLFKSGFSNKRLLQK